MVWQYRSPIPVGRRGVIISLFKWFLPAVATCRGRGGGMVGTLWIKYTKTISLLVLVSCVRPAAERPTEESQDSCRVATTAHHHNQSTLLLRCSGVCERTCYKAELQLQLFSADLAIDLSTFGKIHLYADKLTEISNGMADNRLASACVNRIE